jgi:hypothetical protein
MASPLFITILLPPKYSRDEPAGTGISFMVLMPLNDNVTKTCDEPTFENSNPIPTVFVVAVVGQV